MDEYQYLNLLKKILQEGDEKQDRTGTGTLSCFGEKMEFDISESIPILTTKKMLYDKIIIELLWMISGSTDVNVLKKQNVHFWDANSTREFLDSRGLYEIEEGDIGPGYGFQWRHFGERYKGCKEKYKGIDQLQNMIDLLKQDPFSRRIMLSSWNPSDLDSMALPPCHYCFQLNVVEIDGVKYLDCLLNQRSGDMFLGVPFNIAFYSILTYMLANITGMRPRRLIHVIGDAHIYKNHICQVFEQIKRIPKKFPQLRFKNKTYESIDDFKPEDFIIENYTSHQFIKANMAI